jgi:glycosyltransferase involved in cell wall biosynthesis
MKITAIIITYNEEKNIKNCLSSLLHIADKIIVVDSGSTDQTVEIARSFNCEIFFNKFKDFCTQRNYAVDLVESGWILMLDADERIDEDLTNSIISFKKTSPTDSGIQIYKIARKNYLWGKWLKHVIYPDYQFRFFNSDKELRYKNTLHEELDFNGHTIGKMQGYILHYQNTNIFKIIDKCNKYTDYEAKIILNNSHNFLKIKMISIPILRFIYGYFLKLGLLDGWRGLLWVCLTSVYDFMKYSKALELKNNFMEEVYE